MMCKFVDHQTDTRKRMPQASASSGGYPESHARLTTAAVARCAPPSVRAGVFFCWALRVPAGLERASSRDEERAEAPPDRVRDQQVCSLRVQPPGWRRTRTAVTRRVTNACLCLVAAHMVPFPSCPPLVCRKGYVGSTPSHVCKRHMAISPLRVLPQTPGSLLSDMKHAPRNDAKDAPV